MKLSGHERVSVSAREQPALAVQRWWIRGQPESATKVRKSRTIQWRRRARRGWDNTQSSHLGKRRGDRRYWWGWGRRLRRRSVTKRSLQADESHISAVLLVCCEYPIVPWLPRDRRASEARQEWSDWRFLPKSIQERKAWILAKPFVVRRNCWFLIILKKKKIWY